jgi:bifunctional non-homologous end joining protein LigD
MARSATRTPTPTTAPLSSRVAPQLTQLVDAAPDGGDWPHEIKYDGYLMMARLDGGAVKLLTRTGLDWTHKYPAVAKAVPALDARQAYSTSSASLWIATTRRRSCSSCSIFSISTPRISGCGR